ncbi:MAG: GreA/GreB family elongation factor [Actinomycetota bacterium]
MVTSARAPTPPVLTADGRAFLQARLDRATERLLRVERDLGAERSEELLREGWMLSAQVDELSRLLAEAVAPREVRDDPTIVEVGDEVVVELPDGSREVLLIVHPLEASMDEHRTSSEAPLARAVLGHRPGERVTVETPAGVHACTILERTRIDGS